MTIEKLKELAIEQIKETTDIELLDFLNKLLMLQQQTPAAE